MCAAPSNAYRSKSLWARNKANTANIEHLNAIIHVDKATMLSRFYLDDMAVMRLPDGTDGSVGIVNIGSANYEMHNVARHGSMRDGNRVWLNDGGLNTKGISGEIAPLTEFNLAEYNIKPFTSLAAYYVSGSYGVQINPDGLGWTDIQFGTLGQGQSVTTSLRNIADYLDYNQSVQVRSYHLNVEGKYTHGTIRTNTVGAGKIDLYFSVVYASHATTPAVSRWFTSRAMLLGYLWSNSSATTYAPDGFYVDLPSTSPRFWYQVVSGQITKMGSAVAGGWPSGDPGNYLKRDWAVRSNLESNVCAAQDAPVTTYKSYIDDKHYMTSALTTLATDGYYAMGSGSARTYVQIVNGIEVGSTKTCGIE